MYFRGEKVLRTNAGLHSSSAKRQSKRQKTFAAAERGDGKPRTLPYGVKENICSLGVAEEYSDLLTECLEEAKCIQEIRALANSSEEAVKVLRKSVCTDGILADQVAKVSADLHTALTACAECEGLIELLFGELKSVELVGVDAMYQASRATFVLFVENSVEAVHRAAKAALPK